MRSTRWIGSLAVVSSFALALVPLACAPKQADQGSAMPAAMSAEDKLKRGEYLVAIMGCGDCHTPGTFYGAPDMNRMLSGSEIAWVGPWGAVYAKNLTPDSTGLGAWGEDEIVNALRSGLRPDGRQLAPIMPWADFSHLTDQDAYAIAAFLKSIPPVSHQLPDLVPPGKKVTGSILDIPPPPAWDAPNVPPDTTKKS